MFRRVFVFGLVGMVSVKVELVGDAIVVCRERKKSLRKLGL